MGTAVTRSKAERGLPRARQPGAALADDFRAAVDEALRNLDADEMRGPLLRAAGLRMRFAVPDQGLVLNLAAADDPDHHLRWQFSDDVDWKSRLDLTMDFEVANAYLQGTESIAIAIARGRARYGGDSRMALLGLPAARLIADAYKRVVRQHFPRLRLT